MVYADDITVRTGRVIDGLIYSDEEHGARISKAVERKEQQTVSQPLEDALRSLGFDPKELSGGVRKEEMVRESTVGEKAERGRGRKSRETESHGRTGAWLQSSLRFRDRC